MAQWIEWVANEWVPGLQARSLVGGAGEATTHRSFPLFLPPFPSLKINKIFFKKFLQKKKLLCFSAGPIYNNCTKTMFKENNKEIIILWVISKLNSSLNVNSQVVIKFLFLIFNNLPSYLD